MTFKIVYNSDSNKDFYSNLEKLLSENNIKYESYDSKYLKDRKKGFKVKGAFSARLDPFVGVYDEEKNPIKGFYSEACECTIGNIDKFLKSINNSQNNG